MTFFPTPGARGPREMGADPRGPEEHDSSFCEMLDCVKISNYRIFPFYPLNGRKELQL